MRASLVVRPSRVLLLLTPPFDKSDQDPGYIKGYPPGIRENGGQYTHAAVWALMAIAKQGNGDEAAELFHMLNPINHTRTPPDVMRYRTEPYVLDGDVYARPPHAGRGGWSWYTGSAGWLYRAGLESILGLRAQGDTFMMNPCVPSSWDHFEIDWKLDDDDLRDPRRESRSAVDRRRPRRARWQEGRSPRDSAGEGRQDPRGQDHHGAALVGLKGSKVPGFQGSKADWNLGTLEPWNRYL